jgi:glycosyltransferase involved in cell wall biosynthesis
MTFEISILLPCYRIDDFLELSLVSVNRAASGLSVECLIVANNLNDREVEQLGHLSEAIFSIPFRVVNAGKTDLVGALNFGLNVTKSNFIARMDQDDIMMQARLRDQLAFLKENQNIALVGGMTQVIDSHGIPLGIQRYPTSSKEIEKQLRFGNCFAHPAIMFRREVIAEIGGYDPRFTQAEDFALYVRLVSLDYELSNLDTVVLKYRLSEQQTSSKSRDLQISTTRVIVILYWLRNTSILKYIPVPNEAKYFEIWIKELEQVCRGTTMRHAGSRSENIKIRRALAISNFVIARSSATTNSRNWLVTIKLMAKSIWCSPGISLYAIMWSLFRKFR